MRPTVLLYTSLAAALAACSADSSPPTAQMMHPGGLMLSDLTEASSAKALSGLRQLTAAYHDVDAAQSAGYVLFTAPPATARDGCISDPALGGMGYHYTRGNNIFDDDIDLLNPEFLVYAPTNAPGGGVTTTRLAAVEYFLPFSAKFPAPLPGALTVKAPTLHDFPSTSGLPDIAFTATARFGGWMFHIWLWENNPAGMFENFNTSVPLCTGTPGMP